MVIIIEPLIWGAPTQGAFLRRAVARLRADAGRSCGVGCLVYSYHFKVFLKRGFRVQGLGCLVDFIFCCFEKGGVFAVSTVKFRV